MDGPKSRGSWSNTAVEALNSGTEFALLSSGGRYRVMAEFRDYDGDLHKVGEEWEFVGYSFLPYEDGMTLCVVTERDEEWTIRLQWRPEEQGDVLDHLNDYLEPI